MKPISSTLSPTQVFNDTLKALDNHILAYEELLMIRTRLHEGKMTDELYTFLNRHHDLECLFNGLPTQDQVPEASQEDLMIARNQNVEIAIEGILSKIWEGLKYLWNKFIDWVMDWIDTNRRLKFRLQRHKRKMEMSLKNYGGDPSHYAKIKASVFNYKEQWIPMIEAVEEINELLQKVPQNDPKSWFETNFKDLQKHLKVFGWELNSAKSAYYGVLEERGMKYSRQTDVPIGQGGAGWTQQQLPSVVERTIKLLEKEENARDQFKAVKRAFDRAATSQPDIKDVAALKRLLRICKKNKEFAGLCARTVNDICNLLLREA